MKISVALASKNGEKYIKEQLESFNNQTVLPDELIISDDCSTDKTIELINQFMNKEAKFPVKIFQNSTTLGVSKNFENALMKCSGDIIFISDQDDRWFESKIFEVTKLFQENQSIKTIINNQLITNEDLSQVYGSKIGNLNKLFLNVEKNFCTGSCTAITKDWLEFCMPFQDQYDIWINRLSHAYGVRMILNKPLQFFRRHSSNASDWLVSSPKKISILDNFSLITNTSISETLKKELVLMEKILSKFSQIPQPAISGYIENIKSDHLFLLSYTQDRLDLLNSNYLKRLYKIYL